VKAAIVDGKGGLQVEEIPIPSFDAYQALVKLSYGATCAGTDLRILSGGHPYPIKYPAILGHESVGKVVEKGVKVRSFDVGDLISRVGAPPMPSIGLGACWGGFAQYGVATDWQAMKNDGIPQREWEKARVQKVIPTFVSEKEAPMIITWRETLSYTNRLGIPKGATVLITGSGANALAFVSHFVHAKDKVVVLGNKKRGGDALRLGAQASLDYRSAELFEQLYKVAPEKFDAIVDAVGNSTDVNIALPLLKPDGIIGVYGWNSRDSYGVNPFLATHSFYVYYDGYDESETHDEILERILEGSLNASDWYDLEHPIPLTDIASAYEKLSKRETYKCLIDLA